MPQKTWIYQAFLSTYSVRGYCVNHTCHSKLKLCLQSLLRYRFNQYSYSFNEDSDQLQEMKKPYLSAKNNYLQCIHSEVWSKHTVEWLKRCFQEHPVKLLHGKIMSHPVEKNENVILYTLFWKCMYRGRVAYLWGNLTLSKLAILSVWWKMKIYVYKKVVKIPRVNNMVINLCNTNLLSQESGYTRGEL